MKAPSWLSGFWAWFTKPRTSPVTPPPITTPPVVPVPPVTPPVTPPVVVTPPPVLNPPLVFDAPFTDPSNWVVGRTSAYPAPGKDGNQRNPNDHKLDIIGPDYVPYLGRTFNALYNNSIGGWTADLVTTEGSHNGFKVQTGDVLSATITVDGNEGGWPAIWTWKDGGNEIDVFEYHPDNPNLLELTNHVRSGSKYVNNVVKPGVPFKIQVTFGENSVLWAVNGVQVFADGQGVGPNWSAYLIVNMSVSDGTYHPAPTDHGVVMSADVTNLQVTRGV